MSQTITLKVTSILNTLLERLKLTEEGQHEVAKHIYSLMEQYQDDLDGGKTEPEILKDIYSQLDQIIEERKPSYIKEGTPISCRIGCSHCCHYKVNVFGNEADLLLQTAKAKSIAIDWEYLRQQATLESNTDHVTSKTHSACIFLKENKCSVYEVRPLACRKYMVYTHPLLCDGKFYQHGQVGVIADLDAEIIVSALGSLPEMKDGSMAEMLIQSKLKNKQ